MIFSLFTFISSQLHEIAHLVSYPQMLTSNFIAFSENALSDISTRNIHLLLWRGCIKLPLSKGISLSLKFNSLLSTICCFVQLLSHVWVFCNPMNCSPPGSSVHGISQARILDWIACFLLQGIFLTKRSNQHLLRRR